MIDINGIISILFMIFWLVIIFYGQKLQFYAMTKRLEIEIFKLKSMRDRFKIEGFEFFKSGKPEIDFLLMMQLNEAIEHFSIMPTNLDPYKIVPKIKHILDMREEFYEETVKKFAPTKPKNERQNLEAILEILTEVEMLYKLSRHYFLIAKKLKDPIFIYQSAMIINQVKQIFVVLKNGLIACGNAIPIGDGIGPMIARKLALGKEWKLVAHNTVMAETELEKRNVYIIKAEGSGSTCGRVNDGLARIINKVDGIIMVDAALKTEGDLSGEIIMGEGAAIGGFGVAKFEIEEMAISRKIPLYAILIKESLGEAIGIMSREIAVAVDKAILKILEIIENKFNEGNTIAIIGVGNSGGVPQ